MAKKNKQVKNNPEQEMKKKKFSKLAFAMILIGAVLMVASAGFYSAAPNLYQMMQAVCYFLVCLGGIAFAQSGRYEEDKQKRNNIQIMGLVFIIVAGGRLLTMFFHVMF